jgi:hypothetical protein
MTTAGSRQRLAWLGAFLVALTVLLATLLGAGTSSAAAASAAQTRVGPHSLAAQVVVGPGGGIGAGQRLGIDLPDYDFVLATGVAAKGGVGFADDAVASAFQGMRSGGGHSIRHLRDEGLIANSGSLASQVSRFEELTSPILRSPSATFDWKLGGTLSRGFAGTAGGRNVVVFVAKEGPFQGRVTSAVVPDANQMSQWGLR